MILSLRLLIVLLYTSISNRRSQRRILTTWNNKLSIVKKHLKWKHDKDNNKTDKAISVFRFSTECYREPWVPFKLRQFCNVTTDYSCVFSAFSLTNSRPHRPPPHRFRKIIFFFSSKVHEKQLARSNPTSTWSRNTRIKFVPFHSVFVYIPYFDISKLSSNMTLPLYYHSQSREPLQGLFCPPPPPLGVRGGPQEPSRLKMVTTSRLWQLVGENVVNHIFFV